MLRPFASLLALLVLGLPARAQILPGLTGDALIEALVDDYAPVSVLSSAASKDTLYAVIDRATVDGQDGTVGLYTGLFVPFDCDPSCDPSQDVFNQPNENTDGINQEHTWPRSEGAGIGLAERDMHHLFPTKVNVNSARASLPFGEIDDALATTWYALDQAQSSPPPADERDAWSELRSSVRFEPREEKKGDVARAMFYFYTMYGPDGTGQASDSFFDEMKETLLAWHEADLPTAEEIARSERVAEYQSTSSSEPAINPFVHDATLARRAYFAAPVVYVRADAETPPVARSGISWSNAYGDLQRALALKDTYDFIEEVWVTEGTYRPRYLGPPPSGPLAPDSLRLATFRLRNDLALYGGFSGVENSKDQRDWEKNETVLSGDIGLENDPSDNAYHVVTAENLTEESILDGFTVQDGVADGGEVFFNIAWTRGGGLFIEDSRVSVYRSKIIDNRSGGKGGGRGAGLYVSGSTVELDDVILSDNLASSGGSPRGGGMYVCCDSEAHLSNSTFFENRAIGPDGVKGGGLYVSESTAYVASVRFEANIASGITTSSGGGVQCESGSSCVVVESDFVQNVGSSSAHGGGLSVGDEGEAYLVNSRLFGNEAVAGGALSVAGGILYVTNTLVVGNRTVPQSQGDPNINGGSSLIAFDGSAVLINTSFASNTEPVNPERGTIRLTEDGDSLLGRNVILWNNGPVVIEEVEGSTVVLERSIVQGGYPNGTNILDADPIFARDPHPGLDGEWGTEDDDYGNLHLVAGSPALDFGLAEYLPEDTFDLDNDGNTTEPLPLDLDGNPRVQGSEVDLGAYEGSLPIANEPVTGFPQQDELAAPYPNPARSQATFVLSLASARETVRVEAFDLLGRRVAVLHDGPLAAGRHPLTLDGAHLPAGVYFVRSSAHDLQETQRLVILR